MDAKELRIGNYIERFKKVLQIDSIRKDNTYYLGGDYVGNGICYDTIDAFEPTPEPLLRFNRQRAN